MLKFFLIGLGIMLLIEGGMYGIFPKQMKNLMKLALNISEQKIRNIALASCVIGFCLIYFNIRD
tara:strand:+ start:103 stop:294 length:192 start_codon:yes stop_codon:yes gene_type:complete